MGTDTATDGKRRQWGGDRRTTLPAVAPQRSDHALTVGRIAIVVTVVAWASYTLTVFVRHFLTGQPGGMRFSLEAISYLVIVTALTGSALAYLVTRQGFLHRTRSHRRVPRAVLDNHFDNSMPTLTVLVPSYREEVRVVRATLLSAAFQEYPTMRIVLLIDDPPHPTDPGNLAMLEAARALPGQINELLAGPSAMFSRALEQFESHVSPDYEPDVAEMRRVAATYGQAAAWLTQLADDEEIVDHADRFFVDEVVRALAADLLTVAAAVHAATDEDAVLPADRILQLYRRLAWTFQAKVTSFERKQYGSLSAEPNKAMNLNSYIGLMGGSYRTQITDGHRVLIPAVGSASDLSVPDPDYILTLDADSILLAEYCLRLVYLLEQPENERIAVAQTPYSAFPGAATRLERIAGASTDIQHIVHQGMTYYDATFWVGANAVIRKRALDDLDEVGEVDGWPIHRYVQDTTVIEDTESSVDLGVHGWSLVNYPERLSYSATPPDFGALCIQRQRWADGGLIILPKLWRNAKERKQRGDRMRLGERLLRLNYLASICWASVSLVLMLAYPYDNRLLSPLVIVAAMPYFAVMASDLKRCGYKRTDVLRIYGFNLILLPVNLSGVFKSLGQAITGKKIPFARTPKVRDRTTTPLLFILVPYALVALSAYTLYRDIPGHRWTNAVFAGMNLVLASYAIVAFLGLKNSLVDLWLNSVKHLYRPVTVPTSTSETVTPAPAHWSTVLHNGTADGHFDGRPAIREYAMSGQPKTNVTAERLMAPAIGRGQSELEAGADVVMVTHAEPAASATPEAPAPALVEEDVVVEKKKKKKKKKQYKYKYEYKYEYKAQVPRYTQRPELELSSDQTDWVTETDDYGSETQTSISKAS
jgi:cellulose synthase (UDP-forming)